MKLSSTQINEYKENGFLIVQNVFSKSEIDSLKKSSENFNDRFDLPNIIREKNGAIRSIFAPHQFEPLFDQLYKDDRLITPCRELIENDIYLYQFKLNTKKAFVGEWWEWHQDFPYWAKDDGVQEPKMISVMILFQDSEALQGPLIVIPGSHRYGIFDFEPKEQFANVDTIEGAELIHSLSSDLKYTANREAIKGLLNDREMVIADGGLGTCIFFHPNLLHASGANLSAVDRNTAILTYNDTGNIPVKNSSRPDYLCSRKTKAI